ncbi:SRPBCC family protein [Amycolatopsis dendrobii]|uniref:SRPBCC family protein n=1 Tax=Amycolatopsis dendrobii TaxID=2760662 RepID=A0A7W3W582_9PSEU|nr:SRPBCC family protein [Amycolatopsis dendrobii]MBB1159005.1 SRPBCC family protein [Amycolatopsis dendrobii]
MRLDHSFTVPATPAAAWQLFLDLERVAPCLPGAVLDRLDGESFSGRVEVKVGAVRMSYQGSGTVNRDEAAQTIVLDLEGRESRGTGAASATVTAVLAPDPAGTLVRVRTALALTGRPAQFGRGILAEVSDRIVQQFTARLAEALNDPGFSPAEPEAVDLGAAVAPVLLKKAALPAAALVAVAIVVRLLRRR